jgi:hypothetical protein
MTSASEMNYEEWANTIEDLVKIFAELDLNENSIIDISNSFDDSSDTLFPELDPMWEVQCLNTSKDLVSESTTHVCEETCPICFDVLETDKNITITNCKHRFCSQCILKHASQSNTCPYCREELYMTQLINIVEDDEITLGDEDTDDEITLGDEDTDDEENEDDQYSEYDDNEGLDNIDKIINTMQHTYSYKDLVVLLLQRYNDNDAKYTSDHVDKMSNDFWKTVVDIDMETQREEEERNSMETEDFVGRRHEEALKV